MFHLPLEPKSENKNRALRNICGPEMEEMPQDSMTFLGNATQGYNLINKVIIYRLTKCV
jgi:hypothetical protein